MVVPVACGMAVSVDFFRLIPFLCYHCRSNAVALAGTGHLIVRSSWTGMTLYAIVRVHPRYGEANTTMSGSAEHTAYDENDVLLLPL